MDTPTERSREVVTAFLTALAAGELDEALGLVAADAVAWVAGSTPLSGVYPGERFHEALRGSGAGYRRPDFDGPLRLTWSAVTADHERVAVEAESFGRLPDGRTYNNAYHFLFVVRDGAIAELRIYLDTLHAHEVFCTPDLRL